MTAVVIFIYLLALVAIGVWAAGRAKEASGFFLAGRRLGVLTAALATMASIMSGFVFVGGPGLFYTVGLGSFWIVISSSFTGAMMVWLLAKPLHDLATREGCLTVPDLVLARYGCRFTSGAAAVAIVLGVIGYLATQFVALGLILGAVVGVPFWAGLALGVCVLVFYTTAGGMVAAVYTDIIQGAVMLGASVAIFILALGVQGGVAGASGVILEKAPEVLSPWGSVGPLACLGWFFLFAVGSLGQPHVINKFMMIRDPKALKHFPWILAVSMLVCTLIWLGVGVSVKGAILSGKLAPLGRPDDAVAAFLRAFAPPWLTALTYAAVISAIMSTADSFLNIGAAALTRDLPRALGRSPKAEVLTGRIWSVALVLVSLLFAATTRKLVAYLGILGFGMFAAALTPALALGLNWNAAGKQAARVGVVVGIAGAALLEILDQAGIYHPGIAPPALALALSLLAFVATGLGAQRRP
jgi:Na+/proline symporter